MAKYSWVSILLIFCLFTPTLLASLPRCLPFFQSEKQAFDLVKLDHKNSDSVFNTPVPPFKDGSTLVSGAKVNFKLCSPPTPPSGCKDTKSLAYLVLPGGSCQGLGSGNRERKLIHQDGKINGVALTYAPSKEDGSKYKLKFSITCNKDNTSAPVWTASLEGETLSLTTAHKAGCGYGLDDIMDIFESNQIVCFLVFVGIGLLFTFFGRNSYRWTLLLCGFLIGFLIVAGVAYSFGLFVDASSHTKWGILIAAIVVGVLLGGLLFYYEKHTLSLIVGALLMLVAKAILTIFCPQLELNKWMEMGLLLLVGVLGGVIAHYCKE